MPGPLEPALSAPSSPLVLHPCFAVGPFVFGVSPAACAEAAGPPDRAWDDEILGLHHEQRGPSELAFGEEGLLEVTFSKGARLLAAGVDVFGDPDAFVRLQAADPGATEQKQYLNLPGLGLCLGGFGERKLREGRLAIAYAPSRRLVMSILGTV